MRGGGGNFGIATSFQYRLHPVGTVLGGMVLHPLDGQLSTLSDEAIDTIVAHCERTTSPRTVTLIEHHHGFMCRVAPDATAFPHRDAPYELVILSLWTDPAESERHIGWTRGFFQAMQPLFQSGVYVNALADDESDRVREAYGANYDRLVAVKNTYDPTNFLRLNHNIAPTRERPV